MNEEKAREHFEHGLNLACEGHYKEAKTQLNMAIKLKPGYSEAYDDRLEVEEKLDREALVHYQQGCAFLLVEKYREAIVEFDEAIELSINITDAFFHRGKAHLAISQYKNAIIDFNRVLGRQLSYSEAWIHRGDAYQGLGMHDAAISDYSTVLMRDGDIYGAYHKRGICYTIIGESEKSISDLQKAISLLPSNDNRIVAISQQIDNLKKKHH